MPAPLLVSCSPDVGTAAQEAVLRLLASQLERGEQDIVSVAAYHHGACIVDAWAGRGASRETLFMAASVGKGCIATLLAVLVSLGRLDYDTPVATLVPAFADAGKEHVTVAQAVGHRAGLCPSTPPPRVLLWMLAVHLGRGWLAGWHAAVAWLCSLKPVWPPGTQAGYHHVTWSWVVGAIVAGSTGGGHIRDVFRQAVAEPLGQSCDMHVGVLPARERRRVARLAPPSFASLWRRGSRSERLHCRLSAASACWLEGAVLTLTALFYC